MKVGCCGLDTGDFPRLLPQAPSHSDLISVESHQVHTHTDTHSYTCKHTETQCSNNSIATVHTK